MIALFNGEITVGEWLGLIPMLAFPCFMIMRKAKSNRLEGREWWR